MNYGFMGGWKLTVMDLKMLTGRGAVIRAPILLGING
jgi:hypothetical protein